MRPRILSFCVVLAVLALSTAAWGHVDTPSIPELAAALPLETLAAATPPLDDLWTLVSAAALAMVLIARRRRAVALACVALLMLVAFEAGVHSVHHLGAQPDGKCVIASAAAQTGALGVDTVAFERPAEAVAPVAVMPVVVAGLRASAPDLGRAPPAA
jgi:hypothetical protein